VGNNPAAAELEIDLVAEWNSGSRIQIQKLIKKHEAVLSDCDLLLGALTRY
jgi:hypothetical protein